VNQKAEQQDEFVVGLLEAEKILKLLEYLLTVIYIDWDWD
jgi:hypothetical protein